MAFNKIINGNRSTRGSMRNCIEYALKDEKVKEGLVHVTGPFNYECINWKTCYSSFIDEKNYALLQKYCERAGVNAFARDYKELKKEYLKNTIFSHNLSDSDFSEWGLYGVWEFKTVHERLGGHAAAFPIELPTRYIKMHSYDGDAVLDPFGGTGTTLMACEQLNRICYMMERDPKYVDVIIDRWEKFTGQKAQLIEG